MSESASKESLDTVVKSLLDAVKSRIEKDQTDVAFLIIENDRELMKQYLDAVASHGLHDLNRSIGKEIGSRRGQKATFHENSAQLSRLIQTYSTFD